MESIDNMPINNAAKLGERRRRMYTFLRDYPVGVLSTVTPDNNPHGVVLYFTVDEHLTVRFITRKRTRKYDNLKRNGHVMLTVFNANTQTTVQFTGIAVEHAGREAINEVAMALFMAPHTTTDSGLPPIAKLQAGAFTTFLIEPINIRMASYARSGAGDYNELFESVESFELADS